MPSIWSVPQNLLCVSGSKLENDRVFHFQISQIVLAEKMAHPNQANQTRWKFFQQYESIPGITKSCHGDEYVYC